MILIDGSQGEGGGQVLRTALGLSLATGRAFQIDGIRAGRSRPGLLRQHLTAVRVATAIGRASVEGDTLGSTRLTFAPTACAGGEHRAVIGSAGSAMLVLQAVLPGLLTADAPTRLLVEGGTHNPAAPTFDFLARVFLPLLRRMGARVELTLERAGFYPAGGGRVVFEVEPSALRPLELLARGEVRRVSARALVSGLEGNIAHRELKVLRDRLALGRDALSAEAIADPVGPGNAVLLEVECDGLTELFGGIGERAIPAEAVAGGVASAYEAWLAHGQPVGEHLADQLLVPMALAGGGRFRTGPLSSHAVTNAEGIQRFVDVRVETLALPGGGVEVVVG